MISHFFTSSYFFYICSTECSSLSILTFESSFDVLRLYEYEYIKGYIQALSIIAPNISSTECCLIKTVESIIEIDNIIQNVKNPL